MKKLFVIALCCIAVAFTSCKKEKANQRFIGNYEGKVNATLAMLGETSSQEVRATLNIVAGDTDNRIVATFALPEVTEETMPFNSFELKGTCDGDKVTFDEFTMEAEEDGVPFKFILNSEGTLQNNIFKLNATANAFEGPVLLSTITLNGDLNKK